MKWDLKYAEDGWQIETAIAKKRPLPAWAENEPDSYPGDIFYLTAFNELSSCRTFGEITGPIPWDKIVEYACYKKLEYEMIEPFVFIIRGMDNTYLDWIAEKQRKKTEATKRQSQVKR